MLIRKLVNFIYILVLILCLTSCYKHEKFEFQEGKYEYIGEEEVFYDDIVISNLYIELQSLTDINGNQITNRKNNETYNMNFVVVTNDNKTYNCDFYVSPGIVGDQVDRYYIALDVSKIIDQENATLTLVLEFKNPDYYKVENIKIATEVHIQTKTLKIGDNIINSDLYSFPEKLFYVE